MIEAIKISVEEMQFFDWVSFVASICSIVALPIAVWRIISMKSKVSDDLNSKVLKVKIDGGKKSGKKI